MILTRTKAPQPIAAQPVRQTYTPKTEAEYARLLDALCIKEGKRGKMPEVKPIIRPSTMDAKAKKIMKLLPATVKELHPKVGLSYETTRNRLQSMRRAGMIEYTQGKWRKK